MDPNTTLDAFREAMKDARRAAEEDSNDAEIQALQDAIGYAEALDEWMTNGGFAPGEWGGR